MIVDIHGHPNARPGLSAYTAGLLSSRGAHGKGHPGLNEEQLAVARCPTDTNKKNICEDVAQKVFPRFKL